MSHIENQLGAQHLQRDKALVADVASEIDGRHATAPELTLDHVPIAQGVGQAGCCLVSHGESGGREGDLEICARQARIASRSVGSEAARKPKRDSEVSAVARQRRSVTRVGCRRRVRASTMSHN
jgi:hypothetical protein